MAFTLETLAIQQTVSTTDGNLEGLDDAVFTGGPTPAVVITYDGVVKVYTMAPGRRLQVNGDLTINPEIERLVIQQNFALSIENGATLNLGTQVSKLVGGETFNRLSEGVAIVFDRAPPVWYGSNGSSTGFIVQNGGSLNWRGAEISGCVSMTFSPTAIVAVEDGILNVSDVNAGEIDPTTGNAAARNVGVYTGTNHPSNSLLPAGRGFISWILTPNISIRGWTIRSGGEILIRSNPNGMTNSLNNQTNDIQGLRGEHSVIPLFPNSVTAGTRTYTDTAIARSGNDVDVAVQSETPVLNANGFVRSRIINETQGTSLRVLGAETSDRRNVGSCHIYRTIQVTANSLATGGPVSDDGIWYIIDSDNGFRSNATGIDDTASNVYSATFVGGSSGTQDVLLGSVKVDTNQYTIGTSVIPSATVRTRGTSNAPTTQTTTTNPWTMDLRGKTIAQGGDEFDVHLWHPEYNYAVMTDLDMSDGTVGTLQVPFNLAIDTFYQTAPFARPTEVANLDELYKAEKLRKSATVTSVVEPTISTLYATASSTGLDLGGRSIILATGGTNRYAPTSTSLAVNTAPTGLAVDGNIDTLTGVNNFSNMSLPLPALNITATRFSNLPSTGLLDTAGGVYDGTTILAPGNYTAMGDWSDMTVTRSGNTGTAIITFLPGSTLPTAAAAAGVRYDVQYRIPVDGPGKAVVYDLTNAAIVGTVQTVSTSSPITFTDSDVTSDATMLRIFYKRDNVLPVQNVHNGFFYSVTATGQFTRATPLALVTSSALPGTLTSTQDLPTGVGFTVPANFATTSTVLNPTFTIPIANRSIAGPVTRNLMLRLADTPEYLIVTANLIQDGSTVTNEPLVMGVRDVEFNGTALNFLAPANQVTVNFGGFVVQTGQDNDFSTRVTQPCDLFLQTASALGATPGEIITATEQGVNNAVGGIVDTQLRRSPATRAGRQ